MTATPASRRGALLGALALVAVAATVLAAGLSGAAQATSLVDGGVIARWGAPVVGVLALLAGAGTVGAAALALVAVPRSEPDAEPDDSPEPRRSPAPAFVRCLDIAALSATAWTVLLLADLLLAYALAAGQPITSPAFGSDLIVYLTGIELGRFQLAQVIGAAFAATVLFASRARWSPALGLAFAAVTLTGKALTGHAAGNAAHETAVTGMFLHLVAVDVWIGGLATVLLAARLAARPARIVERYSGLALAAFVVVGLSGIASAAGRLEGPADLVATPYGLLLVAKTIALIGLGAIGQAHRTRTLTSLKAGIGRPFARLAAGELLLMGVTAGLASALASTPPPVPDDVTIAAPAVAERLTFYPLPDPPTLTGLLTTGRLDLAAVTAAVALALGAVWLWRRLPGRTGSDTARLAAALAGAALLAWTVSGPLGVYGRVQTSMHLLEHTLLTAPVALLLAAARPGQWIRRAVPARPDDSIGPREAQAAWSGGRIGRALSSAPVALAVQAIVLIGGYHTVLLYPIVETHLGHVAFLAAVTAAGFATFSAILAPGSRAAALWTAGAAAVLFAGWGTALSLGDVTLAPEWFGVMGRTWAADALADQRSAGIPVAVIGVATAAVAGALAAWPGHGAAGNDGAVTEKRQESGPEHRST